MSLNILVVDDSAVMRAAIIKTLRMSGIPIGEIHQAANGEEGLRVLNNEWIDLALIDINMPVMNGEVMIEKIRQNPEWADLSIVVISTEGSQTRIEILQQKGASFIHKPFTPEDLHNTISQMTGVTNEQGFEAGAATGGSPDF